MRFTLVCMCFVACASGPAPDISAKKGEIDTRREEAATLWRQQRDLEWQAYTKATPVDVAETFRGHEKLYSKATAEALLTEMNATNDKSRQRALRYLRRHILWELTGYETVKSQDELEAQRKAGGVLDLQAKQAKEPDPKKRRELQEAAAQSYEKLSEAHLKLDREITGVTRTLGFFNYIELASELRLVDLSDAERVAETFLAETDAPYLPLAKKVVQHELGYDFEKVTLSDMPRLLRSARYDQYFSEEAVLSLQNATLKPLGMALSEQLGLTYDVDKRPTKQKRPRTFPVLVPSDVRTAVTPGVGLFSYEAALHEAGHALLYTRSQSPVFEFQVLGDQTVVYAYAFVLQNLLANPEWQKTHLTRMPASELAAFSRYMTWKRLALARRYAAKVAFEVAWHDGQKSDLAQLYQNLMSKAHGFRLDEIDAKRWLVDHEPFFLSAQYLRAWFLAAQLEKKLNEKYGARWFERRDAGDFLSDMMKRGLEPTAEELSKELGNGRLDGLALMEVLKPQL